MNVSVSCDFSPNTREIRLTPRPRLPIAADDERVAHCVVSVRPIAAIWDDVRIGTIENLFPPSGEK